MKRIGITTLLLIYCFTVLNLHELVKLKVLLVHFEETQRMDKSLSFIDFLKMHYETDDNNTADNTRDMELPFKSGVNAPITPLVIPTHSTPISNIPAFELKTEHILINDPAYYSNFFKLVFHPPQV
ncbi:MAG TPA: hypothetical protein PLI68_13845 [Bacteroidia bacterium]|nr:hypothetical protein [Bacteroidia bacterium]